MAPLMTALRMGNRTFELQIENILRARFLRDMPDVRGISLRREQDLDA
jgi:hypothetical protein